MIPIYEQGSGNGIGHGLQSFLARFDEICSRHLAEGRARAFAFIFYDFTDSAFRNILKDQGVFARLDRLSGSQLSVFYLHAGTRASVEAFNAHFFSALGVEEKATPPCVVFFRFHDGAIGDIEIAQLESTDLIHGFSELYSAIEKYLSAEPAKPVKPSRAVRWLGGSAKFLSVEAFRAALKRGFELFF